MSKEYSNLMGQVKWAFAAVETEVEEPEEPQVVPPQETPNIPEPEKPVLAVQRLVQTSDYNHIILGIGLCMIGVIGLVVFKKREEV